jgi:hypothetical protein
MKRTEKVPKSPDREFLGLFTRVVTALFLLAAPTEAGDLPGQKIQAGLAQVDAFMGAAVALDGDRLLVGAPSPHWLSNQGPIRPGAVHSYVKIGEQWTLQESFEDPIGVPGDSFGIGLALDGDRALVGGSNASIYEFQATGWVKQQLLEGGYTAALDLEGDTAVAGFIGHASIYQRAGTSWALQHKLIQGGFFGESVDLDGDTLVVGGPAFFLFPSGIAQVYVRDAAGWQMQQSLAAPASESDFGRSVTVSENTLVVGSAGHLDAGAQGTVYVYQRSGTLWTQSQQLHSPTGSSGDYFGWRVHLQGDLLVVGQPENCTIDDCSSSGPPGSAHLYRRVGGQWHWLLDFGLPGGSFSGDQFGSSVMLDGLHGLVGSRVKGALNVGAAGVIELTSENVQRYGVGLAGAGNRVPELQLFGCPQIGKQAVLHVQSGRGAAYGALLSGLSPASIPLLGGELLVAPPVFWWPHQLSGPAGAAGEGSLDLLFTMNDPALQGLTLYLQGLYVDAAAPAGVAMTAGMSIEVE